MGANPAEIRAELERILASPAFAGSARSIAFLRFCVEQSLHGNHHHIKETTVALQVFGRSADYNPRTDPIVRVHARRVREKLERYYNAEGIDSQIQITIPKGTYIPQAVPIAAHRPRPGSAALLESNETSIDRAGGSALSGPVHRQRDSARLERRLWWAVSLFLAILVLLLLIYKVGTGSRSDSLIVAGEPVPFNALPGREQNPSWSPDGKVVAFSWNGGDSAPQIYIQRVGQAEPVRLTHGQGAEFRPVWSPDGREVAFIRSLRPGSFQVARVTVNGGEQSLVGEFLWNWLSPDDLPALDWSPDGKTFLIAEHPSSTAPVRLVLFDLATGLRRPLTNPPEGSSGDIDGKFSPDGSMIAFRRGGLGDLYVVSADGESRVPARRLTGDNPGVRGIAWSRDGRRILFGSMEGGRGWGIWQVNVDGSGLSRVLTGSLNLSFPAASPDGKTLAVEQQDIVVNLMRVPLEGAEAPHLIAPSSRQDYSPVYSPDGKQILFVSSRSGAIELWIANADGSNPHQITYRNGDGFAITPSWSPDGSQIVYAIRRDGATSIWLMSLNTGMSRQLTFTNNRNINPVFAPDGRSIYFNSNDDGIPRIWRVAVRKDKRPEPMMWDASWLFQISSADHAIFYKNPDAELQIDQRDLTTGSVRTVFHSPNWISSASEMCVDRSTIYLIASSIATPAQQDLLAVDRASGAARILKRFDFALPEMVFGCTVSPDGKSLLLPTVQRYQSDIFLAPLR
jgi:Tol biopolymer transport system component